MSHTVFAGTNRALISVLVMPDDVTFTGCTYNGVAMTELVTHHFGSENQRISMCGLVNPDVGTHDVVVTFSGSQLNPTSMAGWSFSSCGGFGATGVNDAATTPNNQTLTVSLDSLVCVNAVSANTQNFDSFSVEGTSYAGEYTHNTGRIVEAVVSTVPTTISGSIAVNTSADTGTVTNSRVEILAVTAPPAAQGNFMPFLVE